MSRWLSISFFGVAFFTFAILPAAADDADDFKLCDNSSKNADEGIPACTRLLEAGRVGMNVPAVYLQRGNGWYAKEDYDRAISNYNEAIDRNPSFVDAFMNRGLAWFQRGYFDRASKDFSDVIRLDPKSTGAYNNRGLSLYNKAEFDLAIKDFGKAISLDPKFANAYNNRSLAWREKRKLDRAISDLDKVISLTPNDVRAYINRASIWIEKGNIDRAIEDDTAAIRLDPKNFTAYSTRGEAFRLKGDLERALADHEVAIGLNPDSVDAYNNRAHVWRDKKDLDRAIADYDEAILRDPQYAQAYAGRGEIWRLKGDLDQSLNDLNKAIALVPRMPAFLYLRGETLREKGEIERAIADFSEAVHLLPDAVAPYTGRGLAFEKNGDLARAKADFQQALKLPSVPDADTAKPAQEMARSRLSALAEAERLAAVVPKVSPPATTDQTGLPLTLTMSSQILVGLIGQNSVKLNGRAFRITGIDRQKSTVTLLGDKSNLESGLGILESAAGWLTFWNEERRLQEFKQPYHNSFAIIAAIDEYDQVGGGFRKLTGMVKRAQELAEVLVGLGFPERNIKTFYNSEATSENLNAALKGFWKGGAQEQADRLFFYFGGHGAGDDGKGYLITYDFKPSEPTLTSFLMSDIVNRHFDYVSAHHVVVVLDSCSSGLAIPGSRSLGQEIEDRKLAEFRKLAIIRADTEPKARNMIVAGTGDQKALWDTGGIFTRALIDGLRGAADRNGDGVVQFDELTSYVRQRVIAEAAAKQVRQEPEEFRATYLGEGKVLFLLPRSE
jgi:tetratricopeptide (TPR) repeat protein